MKTIISIFFLIFFFLSITISSQTETKEEDKKWTKVSISQENNLPIDLNYKFNEIHYYQYHKLNNNIEAIVNPNFRILPSSSSTQSEISVDVHPSNPNIIFASANTTNWPVTTLYGTGLYWSTNGGTSWTGYDNPPIGANSGDPAAVIGPNGNFYIGYIRSGGGQGVSVSTNNGLTWSNYTAFADPGSGDLLDKNHLWVDKQSSSPYINRVYDAWTHFVSGSASDNQVVLNYSTNSGVSWSSFVDLSASLSPGSHAQGVNISTGPNGEVYAAFAIYDNWGTGVYGEDAIGFAKSTNGGVSFTKSRIYSAPNFGIRGNLKPTNIRVSSFPSMAVDRSGGLRNGYIYIVWSQRGVAPAGSDPDIVLIRSTDGGNTWSSQIRVNKDALNNGKDQYYPWCTVDQSSGALHIVFYDNRNTTSDSSGVWMASSFDGGLTFENYQISDANFKPKPISGLASGYQGDYIGITAANGKAYPVWAEDRSGNYQAWSTIVSFGPSITHTPLTNTENLNGPYTVNASITSVNPLVASSIKVYWGRGVGVISDSIVMTNTGGNNYSANIPGNGTATTYNYYISATDNQGLKTTSPANAPANYYSFQTIIDNSPPTITHTPIQNLTVSRFPPTVISDITDNFGIQSVICEYRKNGGSISSFNLILQSGSIYSANFPTISVFPGDIIEYRIKATDNSQQQNFSYNPASGYHSFTILQSLGNILVIDDDVSTEDRASKEKISFGEYNIPLGASANLFATTLTESGYTVDQTTFSALNTATLSNYDVVILSAGVKESSIFNDATKRTALVSYTQSGGKVLVEGGEVGYIYRKQTTELDVNFRRNLLLDSNWVSDRSGASLQIAVTNHPVFTTPNSIPSPITVNNGGTIGYGARDEMTVLPGVSGISRIANWSTGTSTNGGIFIYNPNGDTSICKNIFYSFAISQFADQNVAKNLIENSITYLMRNLLPQEKSLNLTVMFESFLNPTTNNTDTITVELRTSSAPYSLISQIKTIPDNTGNSVLQFSNAAENTPYYVVVKHRNSIETWSASPIQFNSGFANYDFTTAQSKAYGNNLKLVNGKWCIYSGDVNQDGFINSSDVSLIFNSNSAGEQGYLSTDLNYDLFTEIFDLIFVFTNSSAGVQKITPQNLYSDIER
ncbi:sialidase family protein [Ignavibacterium sp.]|uniref:sialidase family protein n=1 Tax=Ignavibacterium sp. TaxID=2651167 RepID=UPI00307F3C66